MLKSKQVSTSPLNKEAFVGVALPRGDVGVVLVWSGLGAGLRCDLEVDLKCKYTCYK